MRVRERNVKWELCDVMAPGEFCAEQQPNAIDNGNQERKEQCMQMGEWEMMHFLGIRLNGDDGGYVWWWRHTHSEY